MIKTIIILSLLVIFLLVVFYPKKKCGCRSNKSNDSLVKKDNKYILTRDGSKTTFNSYSQYLKHYYYNQKDEHPLPLMESNIVSKAFPKIVEGFEDKVVSEEEIPEEEEVIIAEEEETNLNTVREKFIYNVIVQYLKKNPECIKKNKIDQFETAFANFMAFAMGKVLGNRKFDEKGGLATLSSSEFKEYINKLEKMPKCDDLLKNFSKAPAKKQDKVKSKEQDDKVPIKQKVSTTIKQKADSSGKTTQISSINAGSVPTITTIINTNRGEVRENPHGDRRLEPKNAPYLKFFNDISKKLQELSVRVDTLSGNKTNSAKSNGNQGSSNVDNSKYIKQEQDIKNKINQTKENIQSETPEAEDLDISYINSEDKSTAEMNVQTNVEGKIQNNVQIKSQVSPEKRLENANQKLFVDANNTENKMFNDKENIQNIGANFNYKPKVKFDHKEPSKKIMSAYGWSYMPPQTWSVPQKRPPVCIPDDDKQATVKPIFDKGTPVDAMSWTQANNLLPKTEYTEKYNANYYYPGWVAQDKVNYPLNKAGLERSEYYNYNLAKKIE
tara:strand:- start:7187 stop:8851 length:1665 start_codon:yes stop_codon:yes gene_type:complete